ncbi:adenylate/guanylate cyclase domain-containing protein [bacterium]|nr:adenylate/guanylate cyclase domain-containing protein [bacterium]
MDVTVLFVDIRDYTRISENMSGHEVVRLLNSVHERLVKCIFDSGGTLDKYIGDGLMAYFGAPIADSGHADKAVECAERMKQAIAELNKARAANSEAPLTIGIGLHSGVAVVGDVGAEFRREYTVIGDTVNTASRVEALTKKHSIDVLATEAVLNRLSNPQKLQFVADDIVRGRSNSVRTYTLANLSSF